MRQSTSKGLVLKLGKVRQNQTFTCFSTKTKTLSSSFLLNLLFDLHWSAFDLLFVTDVNIITFHTNQIIIPKNLYIWSSIWYDPM